MPSPRSVRPASLRRMRTTEVLWRWRCREPAWSIWAAKLTSCKERHRLRLMQPVWRSGRRESIVLPGRKLRAPCTRNFPCRKIRSGPNSVRTAAVFYERAEEDAKRGDEQPRPALEQLNDAPGNENDEQQKH